MSSSKKTFISLVVILCGFAAIYGLSNFLERAKPPVPEDYIDQDLSLQGAKIKGYALGMEGLIADYYWMQSLQYLGTKFEQSGDETINISDMRKYNLKLVYPYLDNATSLDPHFMAAYEFGAVVLPAIDGEQAIKIAEKGIANNPDNYRLYNHLGYIYWQSGNYKKAAEVYAEGAKLENAPPFLTLMAASMQNKGGSRETARQIYREMFEQSTDKQTKELAELKLSELDWLDERDAMNPILQKFKEKNGRCANDLREILPFLKNVKLPENKEFHIDKNQNLVDPTGVPYILNAEKCEVELADESKLPKEINESRKN
jgi:tetratricopeptide (TPR) repeat protein